MSTWGIIIFLLGVPGYFLTKRSPVFLFVAGLGTGMLIGAIWHYALITEALDSFIFTGRIP